MTLKQKRRKALEKARRTLAKLRKDPAWKKSRKVAVHPSGSFITVSKWTKDMPEPNGSSYDVRKEVREWLAGLVREELQEMKQAGKGEK